MHAHRRTANFVPSRPFLLAGALAFATLTGCSGASTELDSTSADSDAAAEATGDVTATTTTTEAPLPQPDVPSAPDTTVVPSSVAVDDTTPSTTIAPAPADDQPEIDPDPEPGSMPEGLEPLDLTNPGEPTPFEGIVEAFTRVDLPQPTPTPAPTPAPAFTPVELSDDEPPSGGLAAGGLTFVAATGCADHCIDDATISTAGGSSSRYDLRVDLESPAAVEAYLSMAPIQRNADGHHIPPSSVPTASGSAGFFWTTSFDLEPSTAYHLLVLAIDEQGTSSVAGSFTTAEAMGPDALATPSACADGCLEFVSTEFGIDGTEIDIAVRVDVDATIEFAWSTDQFVQDEDGPTLADPSISTIEVGAGSTATLRLGGLTPNTAYSIMATATDGLGGTDRFVGRVATPSPVIYAGIGPVHIDGDGDDGSRDDGEISFTFGTVGGYDLWGHRGEAKISSNTTIQMGGQASGFLYADDTGHYPEVHLVASERDGNSVRKCFTEEYSEGEWRPQDIVEWCNNLRIAHSSMYVRSMTLAEIQQLPTCDGYDVDRPGADRCTKVYTNPNSSDQVSFSMVVWFELD